MRLVFKWLLRLLLLGLAALFALQLYFFVCIGWWTHFDPSSTSFMRAGMSVLHEKNPKAQEQFIWLPYDRISMQLKRAVITSEDAKFAEHEGVDWNAIEKAYENNLKAASNKKPRIKGARPSRSSSPKICSSRASAAMCARRKNWSSLTCSNSG